jgi:hypothetical protein
LGMCHHAWGNLDFWIFEEYCLGFWKTCTWAGHAGPYL